MSDNLVKTIKVKIAAIVNQNGEWVASGYNKAKNDLTADESVMDNLIENFYETDNLLKYWLEVELVIPMANLIRVKSGITVIPVEEESKD